MVFAGSVWQACCIKPVQTVVLMERESGISDLKVRRRELYVVCCAVHHGCEACWINGAFVQIVGSY